jgi:hypothetical protein
MNKIEKEEEEEEEEAELKINSHQKSFKRGCHPGLPEPRDYR